MPLQLKLRMEVRRLDAGYLVGYVFDTRFVPIVEITDTNRVLLHGTKLQIPDDWASDTRRLVQRWIAQEAMEQFKQEDRSGEKERERGGES